MKILIRVIVLTIIVLLIFIGYKIKLGMEMSPYKNRITTFISMLKKGRNFEAQEMLGKGIQHKISVENLAKLSKKYNINKSLEISWDEYVNIDGNCTLTGKLMLKDNSVMDVEFLLVKNDKSIIIQRAVIGKMKLNDEPITGFLKFP